MRAQWLLVGVVSAIALGGTGCGQSPAVSHNQSAPSPARTTLAATTRVRVRIINGMDAQQRPQPITQAAKRHAVAAAIRMVTMAIVPPGSSDVAHLGGRDLTEPAQVSACDPIVDATTLWLIRGSAGRLTTFLLRHVPRGMRNDEAGSMTSGGVTTSYSVADVPAGKHPPQRTLVFTFAPVGRATGLRVDALTIPSRASCMSAGGGAEATSSAAPGSS
jgi:hypothetical protein